MSTSSIKSNKWLSVNTFFLVGALVLAITALVYAIKNRNEIEDIESKVGVKSKFTNGGGAARGAGVAKDMGMGQRMAKGASNSSNNNVRNYGYDTTDLDYQRSDPSMGVPNWWDNNAVNDGNDSANNQYNGKAQSQCPPPLVPESAHSYRSSSVSAPSMLPSSMAIAGSFPDETASVSLAGKTTYSCAPDVTNAGGCDYALNPDNLMPGSWRAGVGCSDGTDPNSQWAKYHPTREKYYRYITAAGSARLGVVTRAANNKILGVPLLLRSATATPLSDTQVTFNDSPLRQDTLFNALGHYPGSYHC